MLGLILGIDQVIGMIQRHWTTAKTVATAIGVVVRDRNGEAIPQDELEAKIDAEVAALAAMGDAAHDRVEHRSDGTGEP